MSCMLRTSLAIKVVTVIPVYFDIDGVLRLLDVAVLRQEPTHWIEEVQGESFMDYVGSHLNLLASAPASLYIKVVQEWCKFLGLGELLILTAQPVLWQEHTEMWLSRYFTSVDVTYVSNVEEKAVFLGETKSFVLDDSPFFPSYSNVALVTRKYNTRIDAPIRIFDTSSLKHFLAYSFAFDYAPARITVPRLLRTGRRYADAGHLGESFEELIDFYQFCRYRNSLLDG